ncbi:uncharacterized protein ASCRUDRAFT_75997 [Ascoidea rubescens DSM 1968]|uniref:Uncharacterized protein n=1 Tax=Ascoidea rubescens DSM 1968 TaxID=1344418 RepID=A0A1D2VGC4_9ASCO|nr:hypothetical protein ASCRUDRAFT_75997 [Ascoidea rubescens DSM 1968]ODV60590.1 hypothetical protein ASCRUDRAFT_75997 [Ascoidea rubescens DSM 1968]
MIEYDKNSNLNDKYTVYSDTFISEEIDMSENILKIFGNKKNLNEHVLLKCFNTKLFKLEAKLIGKEKFLKKPKTLDTIVENKIQNQDSNYIYIDDNNNIVDIFEVITFSSNSYLLKWQMYLKYLVAFFEKISNCGSPWRLTNGGFLEIFIWFIPNQKD